MRIAVFIKSTTYNESFGGLETQNKLLCEGLSNIGHEVCVISPSPEDFNAESLGMRDALRVTREGDLFRITHNVLRVTYCFVNAPTGKYSQAWWRESLAAFQKLHEEEPFDVVISQSAAGQVVVRRKKEFGIPVVVIQHGTIFGELKTRFRNSHSLRDYLFFFLRLIPYGVLVYVKDQLRLRAADRVIAVSDQVKDALVREYFLPPSRIAVVYNGVEIEKYQVSSIKYQVRKDLGIGEEDKVVLYVGRVEKEKGLGVLLKAVSRIPHTAYRIATLIVGDGPYLLNLEGSTRELGIEDRVIFTGRVPYGEVPKYYAAADIFVLPSLREEGLPMTLPEAMASGLPIIASRIGGISSVVEDSKTGLPTEALAKVGILVEPGNVEDLSAAILKVLADDKFRSRMGQSARRVAEEKFSQEAMVGKTLNVIRYALRGREGTM